MKGGGNGGNFLLQILNFPKKIEIQKENIFERILEKYRAYRCAILIVALRYRRHSFCSVFSKALRYGGGGVF